jgi:peptidoglycan/xylan/chitin deacetylase (PgdA/CDA1 family)
MRYDISIRVTFPEAITNMLRIEKQRFINDYGSSYKSEPHITLYLDSYTSEGYPKLLAELRTLRMKPFNIFLLAPKIRTENERHRNLYIMDVSNKQQLHELHGSVSEIAIPYRSPFIPEKTQKRLVSQGINTDGSRESLKTYKLPKEVFDPHITLGEIDFDKPQADIAESQRNLKAIEGKEIMVSSATVFWYGKEDSDEKAHLIEEVTIPFNQS